MGAEKTVTGDHERVRDARHGDPKSISESARMASRKLRELREEYIYRVRITFPLWGRERIMESHVKKVCKASRVSGTRLSSPWLAKRGLFLEVFHLLQISLTVYAIGAVFRILSRFGFI